ncbi:5735_t:CDS:2, partial [Gigaspora rosea]
SDQPDRQESKENMQKVMESGSGNGTTGLGEDAGKIGSIEMASDKNELKKGLILDI